jgi:hypothetical protein
MDEQMIEQTPQPGLPDIPATIEPATGTINNSMKAAARLKQQGVEEAQAREAEINAARDEGANEVMAKYEQQAFLSQIDPNRVQELAYAMEVDPQMIVQEAMQNPQLAQQIMKNPGLGQVNNAEMGLRAGAQQRAAQDYRAATMPVEDGPSPEEMELMGQAAIAQGAQVGLTPEGLGSYDNRLPR